MITRWNDIHIVLFAAYFLFLKTNDLSAFLKRGIPNLLLFSIVVFLIFFFTQGLAWKVCLGGYFTLPYDPVNIMRPISVLYSFASVINVFHIFVGLDWGLLYTMLPFVIGFFSFFWFNPLVISRNHILDRIIYAILFSLPFIIVLKWQQQGSYYGYRHLLSLLPFTCIGLAAFFNRIRKVFPNYLKYLYIFMVIILIFNFFLILPLEYDKSTTLELGSNVMGGYGWVNNAYVINAIKIYFISPVKTLLGLFIRGFMGGYIFGVIYLIFPDVFSKIAVLNPKIQKYFALDSFEKGLVLFYPLLAIGMLAILYIIMKKIYKIEKRSFNDENN